MFVLHFSYYYFEWKTEITVVHRLQKLQYYVQFRSRLSSRAPELVRCERSLSHARSKRSRLVASAGVNPVSAVHAATCVAYSPSIGFSDCARLLGRIACIAWMRPVDTDVARFVVCASVCLLCTGLIQLSHHCLDPLLPSSRLPYSRYSLRSGGHRFSLPQLNTVLYRNMFINRCLFPYI